MSGFTTRHATATDVEFLWTIQRDELGDYVVESYGYNTQQQRKYFDEHFDYRRHLIIQVDGIDAGFLCFENRESHIYLANIALVSSYQRRGLGEEVVRYVMYYAFELGLPVRLQVLRSNPAVHFYVRLGFVQYAETDSHFLYEHDLSAS